MGKRRCWRHQCTQSGREKIIYHYPESGYFKRFRSGSPFLWLHHNNPEIPRNFVYFLALAAIMGHNFSLFIRFKGGKGVATTLGTSVLIAPFSVIVAVILFFMVKWRFKYVSLGSLALALSMPLTELILYRITPDFYYLSVCAVLIIIMHFNNFNRLIHGKELSSDKI
jgi:acyl-phosphate glycerol 3-phosphate acyltransferase